MEIFEDYLAAIGGEVNRARFREMLEWIGENFPNLEPRFAWNQPMFTDHGTFIIGFSVSKTHFAVAPEDRGMEKFAGEIDKSGYSRGAKIFRIKWNEPIDFLLLEQIIRFNMEDKAECTTFWRK